MDVIGVDPSLRRTGLAKLQLDDPAARNGSVPKIIRVHEAMSITSDTNAADLDVIAEVHEGILELGGDTIPVFIEVPYFARNASVLMRQAYLVGGISALLDMDDNRPVLVNPSSVKALLGIPRGQWSNKDLVVNAVRSRVGKDFLEEATKLDREAVCDAIGVALAGCFLGE